MKLELTREIVRIIKLSWVWINGSRLYIYEWDCGERRWCVSKRERDDNAQHNGKQFSFQTRKYVKTIAKKRLNRLKQEILPLVKDKYILYMVL